MNGSFKFRIYRALFWIVHLVVLLTRRLAVRALSSKCMRALYTCFLYLGINSRIPALVFTAGMAISLLPTFVANQSLAPLTLTFMGLAALSLLAMMGFAASNGQLVLSLQRYKALTVHLRASTSSVFALRDEFENVLQLAARSGVSTIFLDSALLAKDAHAQALVSLLRRLERKLNIPLTVVVEQPREMTIRHRAAYSFYPGADYTQLKNLALPAHTRKIVIHLSGTPSTTLACV